MTKRFRRHSKRLWVTVALGASVIAYLFLGFMPMQRSIGQLRVQLAEQRRHILDVDQRFLEKANLERQIGETKAFVSSQAASREEIRAQLGNVLEAFSELAEKSKVVLQRMAPGTPEAYARIARQPLIADVSGRPDQVFTFLGQIESLPEAIWIEHLHLERSGEDGQLVTARLNLTIFGNSADSSD